MTTDTASVVRLYLVSAAVAALIVLWAVLARTPFPGSSGTATLDTTSEPASTATATDPRIAALNRREAQLQVRARQVAARRDARWATYRRELAARQAANAAAAASYVPAPSVPVIGTTTTHQAPAPTTSTRSS